ncbi:MAG: ATPase [Kangiella sp.]|nr:MAG: ATPase [Kangiella sp.]
MVEQDNKFLNQTLYIGIDGGGTKCRAILTDANGLLLGEGLGGPANPFYGVERACNSIEEASLEAVIDAGLPPSMLNKVVAGVGLAGVNLPNLHKALSDWKNPFLEMYLTTDMDIANIGAHDDMYGAAIIIGTGSVGYVNTPKTKFMLGGYGFPISDKASGAWLGLKAIEHTLLVLDRFKASSLLAEKVCDFYQINTGIELSEKLVGYASSQYAKIASLVFNCASKGDEYALEIVEEGVEYISILASRLVEGESLRLSMIGGLAKYWRPQLDSKTSAYFSDVKQQPEFGALKFAIQNWTKEDRKIA